MDDYEKSCGAVVCKMIDGDIYTLVVRHNAGQWGFPKGHVEKHETELETASREVEEETGVRIRFVNGFREETHYSPRPGVKKDVVYFLAQPGGGEEKAEDDEIAELRWVRLSEALALLTYGDDVNLLKKAVHYIKINTPDVELDQNDSFTE